MKHKIFWIGLIVGLLGMSMVIYGIGVYFALNDPSFAVEPDYQGKAARWDEIRHEQKLSDELGWTADLETVPAQNRGEVDVKLTLTDSKGDPVKGAKVEVECFHNARAANIYKDTLPEISEGVYGKTMPLARPGIWEFRLRVTHDDDVFVKKVRKSVYVGQ